MKCLDPIYQGWLSVIASFQTSEPENEMCSADCLKENILWVVRTFIWNYYEGFISLCILSKCVRFANRARQFLMLPRECPLVAACVRSLVLLDGCKKYFTLMWCEFHCEVYNRIVAHVFKQNCWIKITQKHISALWFVSRASLIYCLNSCI